MGLKICCGVGLLDGNSVGGSDDGQAANSHPALTSLVTVEPSKHVLVSSEQDGHEKKEQSFLLMSRPRIVPSAQSILSSGFTPSGHNVNVGE